MQIEFDIPYIDLFLFSLFCLIEGLREAAKDAHGGSNGQYPYNVHLFYFPIRAMVGLLCMSFNTSFYSPPFFCLLSISYMMVFIFLHDGMYYTIRKRLEPNNPKLSGYHWFGKSETTTALQSYPPVTRVILLILGLGIYSTVEVCSRIFGIG